MECKCIGNKGLYNYYIWNLYLVVSSVEAKLNGRCEMLEDFMIRKKKYINSFREEKFLFRKRHVYPEELHTGSQGVGAWNYTSHNPQSFIKWNNRCQRVVFLKYAVMENLDILLKSPLEKLVPVEWEGRRNDNYSPRVWLLRWLTFF